MDDTQYPTNFPPLPSLLTGIVYSGSIVPVLNKILVSADPSGAMDVLIMPSIVRIQPTGKSHQPQADIQADLQAEAANEETEDAVEKAGSGRELNCGDQDKKTAVQKYAVGNENSAGDLRSIIDAGKKLGGAGNPAVGERVAYEMLGHSIFRGVITKVSSVITTSTELPIVIL